MCDNWVMSNHTPAPLATAVPAPGVEWRDRLGRAIWRPVSANVRALWLTPGDIEELDPTGSGVISIVGIHYAPGAPTVMDARGPLAPPADTTPPAHPIVGACAACGAPVYAQPTMITPDTVGTWLRHATTPATPHAVSRLAPPTPARGFGH